MDLNKVKILVLAGGGVRGLAFVGALQVLRDERGIDFGGKKPLLDTVAGVSIGSMFALMIVTGYTVAEITEVASSMKSRDVFITDPVRLLGGQISLDDGEKLKQFIINLLLRKSFPADVTFAELYEKTKMGLHVTVSDLTSASPLHLSWENHGNLSVVTGLLASMTLPLLYPPVVAPDGHLWIDGGIMDNSPMMRYNPDALLGFDFKINSECKADSLVGFITRVLYVQQVPIEVMSWKLMSREHQDRCVIIDTGMISNLNTLTDLSLECRTSLLRAGTEAARRKIREWEGKMSHDPTTDPGIAGRELPSYLKFSTLS